MRVGAGPSESLARFMQFAGAGVLLAEVVAMHIPKTESSVGRRIEDVIGWAELSRSLFDDALVTCDDEREAAFWASARLLLILEDQEREERSNP